MKTVIVIPARYGSSRFPGKPLAMIKGTSLLQRVWNIAKAVKNVDDVVIATDHKSIMEHGTSFGATTIFTDEECDNGTERTFAVLKKLPFATDIAINLQGDAVLTPPWVVQSVVTAMQNNNDIKIATPATQFTWEQYDAFVKSKAGGRVSGTSVVFDKNHKALYFSKGIIPFLRDRKFEIPPVHRHIGLYGYRYTALKEYVSLSPTTLEQAEKLEQLRAIENGIPIQIVLVDYKNRTHWSVDNPEDLKIVEEIIEHDGELI